MSTENTGFVTVPTFKQPNIVPLLKIDRPDLLATIAGGTLGLMVWTYFDLSAIAGGVLTFIGFGIGILYVASAPSYLDAWQWTKTLFAFTRKPRRYASTQEAAEMVNDKAFTTGEETRELTNVARFYPSKHVVERKDGSLVAFVEIDPPHRDFATPDDWFSVARSIAEWFNNTVDFEFQLYATTQPFPIETHLQSLEDRLTDSDVLGNTNLRALIEERLAQKQQSYEEVGTEITHFYIVIPIRESEVATVSETDQTPLERLQRFSGIGIIFEILEYYLSGQAERSETETRLEMARRLRNRVATVMGLGQRLETFGMRRMGIAEIVALQRQFWRPTEARASTDTMQPRSLPASTIEESEEVTE